MLFTSMEFLFLFFPFTLLLYFLLPHRLRNYLLLIVSLFLVLFGWVLFHADSLPIAAHYIRTMLGLAGAPLLDDVFRFQIREYALTLCAAVLCATPIFSWIRNKLSCYGWATVAWEMAVCALQLFFFLCGVSMLVMKAHNPFMPILATASQSPASPL